MSAPRSRKPRHRQLTRRDFLCRAALGSAFAGGLPLLPGCGSSDGVGGRGPGAGAAEFRHGVASGDPLSDRVILWTRVSGVASQTRVDYEIWSDAALTETVSRGSVLTDAARDFTVKVDASGLRPGTTYYYRFSAGAARSPIGRTRTAPQGTVDRLRVGVASCSSLAHGYFNAYRRLAERADLDLVLHLGDYIYEYGTGEYGDVRAYEPGHEILTLDDYRTRHAQYKSDPDLQELHRQHPVVSVWDDHETTDNSWRDGANNHTEGEEGIWTQRKAWGIQAYHEWLPVRTPDTSRPELIYRRLRYGDLADFVMLDTRLVGRDLQAALTSASDINDEARSLLGADQLSWLTEQLAASGTTWKVLGQQVMFGQLRIPSLPELSALTGLPVEQLQVLLQNLPIVTTGGLVINTDQWDGYRAERSRVFDLIEHLGVENPVVLTGDIHSSWSMDLSRDPANPLAYNAITGDGSVGVEFVCTSITSPALEPLAPLASALRLLNPHMKYIDLARKGYLLLDITAQRMVGEYWYVDTVAEPAGSEAFAAAFSVEAGARRLRSAGQTTPKPDAPLLAP